MELDASATLTDATGTGVTVMEEVPLFPSLVAVIVAEPGVPAVTRPVGETVATDSSLDDQLTALPTSTLFASLVSAESCCVEPATILAVTGLTVTVATGAGVTVSSALPVFPSLVAVMLAAPGLTAVTNAVEDTVATLVLSEVQVTTRPLSIPPFASWGVAVACVVPTAVIVLEASPTLTDATGAGVIVNAALPVFPSLVAAICAVPTETAVTTPVVETVATPVLSELQVTARPVSSPPLASRVVAVACAVSTAVIVPGTRATVTDATGIGTTVIVALPLFPSLVAVIVAVPGATAVTTPADDTVATD
jgi:hypothetical protein